MTDANGEYYFVSSTTPDPNPADHVGQVNGGVAFNTAYQVRVDNPADYVITNPLFGLTLTRANETTQLGDDDASDSDATNVTNPNGSPAGTFPVISLTTGGPGSNNHTFDVGFAAATTAANVTIDGRVMLSTGEGIRNARIFLTEQDGTTHIATTGSFGFYRFDGIVSGQTVLVRVVSKRFTFADPVRVISLDDNIANLDFIAEQ